MSYLVAFNDSFERVVTSKFDLFFRTFYKNFDKRSPQVAVVFNNMPENRRYEMLADSILLLMDYGSSHEPSSELRKLALVHKRVNVTASLYHHWIEALIFTVLDLDDQASPETEKAWRAALGPGINFMINHGCADFTE